MQQLRLLHLALCLSAIAALLACVWLRSSASESATAAPAVITYVLMGFAGMIILSAATVRTRISTARGGEADEAWITENKTRCIVLWAMLEGGAAICGIALFLGADPWVAGALAAGALGFLLSQSPGTLAGH